MSFDLQILEKKSNPLLNRTELTFFITKFKGTPNRMEVKKKIAALDGKADENLVFIKKMKTVFGVREVSGRANIYDAESAAKEFEPAYIFIRNIPKEEREDARKKLRDSKKKKKKKA